MLAEITLLMLGKLQTHLLGADVSSLLKMEQLGIKFYDFNGKQSDPVKILIKNGANTFRLRLFVEPSHKNVQVNDLNYTLKLAKRIKKCGAKTIIDFHFSDTWADPSKQAKPRKWRKLPFEKLKRVVEKYTFTTMETFKSNGILPFAVQIGNEITHGFLWPDGKLDGTEEKWKKFAELLKAGINGVKRSSPDVKIIIHTDTSTKWNQTKWFFSNLIKRGVKFDIIGFSYYPWWHGTIDTLRKNLTKTLNLFKKPIIIVETAYPYRSSKWKKWNRTKSMKWEISPYGQMVFLRDILKLLKIEGVEGVLWWYPESIPAKGIFVWNDGTTALFDENGKPLPAIKEFLRVSKGVNQ